RSLLWRDETTRQRSQLPRDVQQFGFRPVWADELDADGKTALRCGERHDQRRVAARVEWSDIRPAVVVVGSCHTVEIERAAVLAAWERRTKRDGREQHIVTAEEGFDVLDPPTLDTERRRVILRLHLEGTTQEPHHVRLPLEEPARNEQREDLAQQPGHVLSKESALQLDEHFGGARVDRRRRLHHMP